MFLWLMSWWWNNKNVIEHYYITSFSVTCWHSSGPDPCPQLGKRKFEYGHIHKGGNRNNNYTTQT